MITLSGLRWLWQQRKAGRDLPEMWPEDVRRYLSLKREMCRRFGRPWDREQLREAEGIVRCLYG